MRAVVINYLYGSPIKYNKGNFVNAFRFTRRESSLDKKLFVDKPFNRYLYQCKYVHK